MDSGGAHKLKVSELAKLAGVSPATVSKVINGRSGISEETRAAVEAILKQHGYSRPLVSTKVSPTIELVVEYIEHNGTMELIRYASHWAQQAGLAITVTQTDHGNATESCLRGIIDRNPLGVIMQQLGGLDDEIKGLLRSRGIPLVVIDPIIPVDDDVMGVSIDNWSAGYQAAQHLIDLGHTRIGVIRGLPTAQSSVARYGGMLAAFDHAGIPLQPQLEAEGDYLPERGYAAACTLLDLDPGLRPTAILACNDLTAVSIYRAARERGIDLPSQLSVIGFDDVYPAQYLKPSLTTIHQPFDEIGRRDVQLILDTRENRPTDRHVILPAHLVRRESTVAAAGANGEA